MAAASRGLATTFGLLKLSGGDFDTASLHRHFHPYGKEFVSLRKKKWLFVASGSGRVVIKCCNSDSIVRTNGARKGVDKLEEWRCDTKCNNSKNRVRVHASPARSFASSTRPKQEKFFPRCTPRTTGPQSRDSPPKRDTGIANEKDWGISLLHENVNESGTNEDGSTWYRESVEDEGDNGYRCRWSRMGGQSYDGTSEWKETVDAFNWIC